MDEISGFLQAKIWWVAIIGVLAFVAGLVGFGSDSPKEPEREDRE